MTTSKELHTAAMDLYETGLAKKFYKEENVFLAYAKAAFYLEKEAFMLLPKGDTYMASKYVLLISAITMGYHAKLIDDVCDLIQMGDNLIASMPEYLANEFTGLKKNIEKKF